MSVFLILLLCLRDQVGLAAFVLLLVSHRAQAFPYFLPVLLVLDSLHALLDHLVLVYLHLHQDLFSPILPVELEVRQIQIFPRAWLAFPTAQSFQCVPTE